MRVVVTSPFPVSISSGRHLAPGETAEVPDNELTRTQLASYILRRLPKIETAVELAPPPRKYKGQSEVTSQETE